MRPPREFWQLLAFAAYLGVVVLISVGMELRLTHSLIVTGVVFAYALGARSFRPPWRYALAAVPWLVVASTIAYFAAVGGFDCGSSCGDGAVAGWISLLAWLLFAAVIVAGPAIAIGRWRRRRRSAPN